MPCFPQDHHAGLPWYLHQVHKADLPESSKQYFIKLGGDIVQTGSHLLLNGNQSIDNSQILARAHSLFADLHFSSNKCMQQVENIAYIKERAPFNVTPADHDVWSNYQQRVRLIIEHTALPCRTERKLLDSLTHVFDAYMYHPFLQICGQTRLDSEVEDAINGLYDTIMTLVERYAAWCRGAKDLRDSHMLPLANRINCSSEVLHGIEEWERSLGAARVALSRPEAPGLQPADENIIQALNLSARRRQPIPARSKTRYQRQHTV